MPIFIRFIISIQALEKRERIATEQAEKQLLALNINVAPEVQALFDRLNFMCVQT